MKLSISTLGCPDWDFIKIVTEFQRLGMQGIEVRGIAGKMDADEISWFTKENQEKTNLLLRQHDLKIVGLGTSVSFHDESSLEENIKQGKRAIDVCVRLSIPAIRVFGNNILSPADTDTVVSRVIFGLKELCSYAETKNVKVNLEIHGDFNRSETVSPILQELKAYPQFGILWDIQHSDKIYGDHYLPFYQLIKPYIRHVHIKDHIRKQDGLFECCLLGKGDIPVKEIVKQLLDDGYEGYLSLEWEKKWQPDLPDPEIAFPEFAAYMKTLENEINAIKV